MPNLHRGEIEAEIGGKRRRLVLTLGALAELEAAFALVPEADRQLITSHEAFAYLGERYGFTVDSVLGMVRSQSESRPVEWELRGVLERAARETDVCLTAELRGEVEKTVERLRKV